MKRILFALAAVALFIAPATHRADAIPIGYVTIFQPTVFTSGQTGDTGDLDTSLCQAVIFEGACTGANYAIVVQAPTPLLDGGTIDSTLVTGTISTTSTILLSFPAFGNGSAPGGTGFSVTAYLVPPLPSMRMKGTSTVGAGDTATIGPVYCFR